MIGAPWREMGWWGEDRATLRRVLADQLHSELRRLRLGEPGGPPPWLWDDDTPLDAEGAPDSLDLLSLSAALAEMLPDAEVGLAGSWRFGDWCGAAARAGAPRHVTLRSSGSTAAPARTTHRLDVLEREAAAFAVLLGARRRVLCAVPSHHAYGFIHSVLLPRHLAPAHLAPHGVVEVVELRGQAASRLASLVRPGDLVLGHPAFWDAALRGMFEALPPDVIGVTSAAPCPDATALGLRAAGLARLVQVYGSAETAGIGWRDDPAQPYALLPGWRRDGAGLRRDSGAQDGRAVDGQAVDGPAVDGQAVDAPDRLAWEGERFRVLGRRDGAVQVGGVNVSPEQVGARLARHPGVAEVAVRAMRPEEGARLKAFVVPAGPGGDPGALRAELRRFAAAELAAAERPGAYAFGEALPRNGMGKLADWGGGSAREAGKAEAAPRTPPKPGSPAPGRADSR